MFDYKDLRDVFVPFRNKFEHFSYLIPIKIFKGILIVFFFNSFYLCFSSVSFESSIVSTTNSSTAGFGSISTVSFISSVDASLLVFLVIFLLCFPCFQFYLILLTFFLFCVQIRHTLIDFINIRLNLTPLQRAFSNGVQMYKNYLYILFFL